MLIHIYHAVPLLCCAVALISRFQSGTGTARVNQTRSHYVNQMETIQSKSLATRHGRGTARAGHDMRELAFMEPSIEKQL